MKVIIIKLAAFCFIVSFVQTYTPTPAPGGTKWLNCTIPNEYYDCGSACQTECRTLGQQCPIINKKCNDACYCIANYARDYCGRCIPIKECPGLCRALLKTN